MAKTFGSRLFGGYRKREVDLALWEQNQRQSALEEENGHLTEQVETLARTAEELQARLTAAEAENEALHRKAEADAAEFAARLRENEAEMATVLQEAKAQKQKLLAETQDRVRDLWEALDRSGADSRKRFDAAMAMFTSASAPLREKVRTAEEALTELRAAALSLPAAYNRLQDARATAQADLETALACFCAGEPAEFPAPLPNSETDSAAVFFDPAEEN